MATLQCISCNSQIPDTVLSCTKCSHVNQSMRTIAGKRFSGYREELYTRRAIKESKEEYLKMRRESRGIKRRLRGKAKIQQPDKVLDKESKLEVRLQNMSKLIDDNFDTNFQTTPNTTIHCKYNKKHINNEKRKIQYVSNKKRRRHRQVARQEVKEHLAPLPTTPMYHFSMEVPLAEINKRLINQRAFWACLADWPL